MAWRQYFSCRTVRRIGTFAPALSQPSGQEFLRLDLGAVVMVPVPQLGESVALPAGPEGRGRAATEPHKGGAARRSLRYGHGSAERRSRSKQGMDMRGVHPRTEGSWRRSLAIS